MCVCVCVCICVYNVGGWVGVSPNRPSQPLHPYPSGISSPVSSPPPPAVSLGHP